MITTHEKVAHIIGELLGEEAVDAIVLAGNRAKTLTQEQEVIFLVDGAIFSAQHYLRPTPDGHVEQLSQQLLAYLESGDDVLVKRGRAANSLISLAVLAQPSLEDGAKIVHEQIQRFNNWFETNIDNRKEE